ncbi:MAG TPA: dTMP kinase [Anaerolineae bacterium]|nr:dTMP kinase [Anaerolineae bacterium]
MFITFEGPDGSGKTTQLHRLQGYLLKVGYPIVVLREPGGTDIGDQIRQVLHDPANVTMDPRAEVLLYSASRAQLTGEVIVPALRSGKMVLCDRFAESTMAYQGYGHRFDLDKLKAITAFATGGIRPDLVIYLDIEVEEGLRRKARGYQAGQGEWNRMDQKEVEFHRRAREGYLAMAAAEPERWFVLDATLPVEVLQRSIRRKIKGLLAKGCQPRDTGEEVG